MSTTKPAQPKPNKSARRLARELAVQGIYEWLVSNNDPQKIRLHLGEPRFGLDENFNEPAAATPERPQTDFAYLSLLFYGVIEKQASLSAAIQPHLDRSFDLVSPVEKAIVLVGAYELVEKIEVPYRVAINESVEIAKVFGGTDGHKFVNGVLDKLAQVVRAVEITAH